MTNLGLYLELNLKRLGHSEDLYAATLRSYKHEYHGDYRRVSIVLRKLWPHAEQYARIDAGSILFLEQDLLTGNTGIFVRQNLVLPRKISTAETHCFHIRRSQRTFNLVQLAIVRVWPETCWDPLENVLLIPDNGGDFVGHL
jgi:hypothetical protein